MKSQPIQFDPNRLITLLSQQRDLYRQLGELSKKQRSMISGDRPELLLDILRDRQELVTALARLNEELGPFRRNWDTAYSALPEARRAQASEILLEINGLLRVILRTDQEDGELLSCASRRSRRRWRTCRAGRSPTRPTPDRRPRPARRRPTPRAEGRYARPRRPRLSGAHMAPDLPELPEATPADQVLGGVLREYLAVTGRLQQTHAALQGEVERLRQELASKDRELEVRRRLAALGELAAGVAHEVRNPLGAIRLYSDLLRDQCRALKLDPALQLLKKIDAGIQAIDAVVQDTLALVPGDRQIGVCCVRTVIELARDAAQGGADQPEREAPGAL